MKIAILDDFQNVALKMADWSAISRRAECVQTTICRVQTRWWRDARENKRCPPQKRAQSVAVALRLASEPAGLFEIASCYGPSRIAEAVAHVGRPAKIGAVLLDFTEAVLLDFTEKGRAR